VISHTASLHVFALRADITIVRLCPLSTQDGDSYSSKSPLYRYGAFSLKRPNIDLFSSERSALVSTHDFSSPVDLCGDDGSRSTTTSTVTRHYPLLVPTTFEYAPRPLHLRSAFGHGAYIRSHIYVEQHSSSATDRLCRAESTSGPSILRTLGVKISEL